MRLTFAVTAEQRLIITEEAVAQMLKFAQHSWYQTEAGGVLLGRHLLESEHVVIDEVTTPQRQDKRSRFGFFRSTSHHQLAQRKWELSKETLAYLGLWHTHPEDDPSPSGVDRHDWERAVATHTYHGGRLYFPIVGRKRIRVWTKTRTEPIRELIVLA
ncbi:Mov34/MPN/PAD-1 family protein [Massilia oculi]|uniref:Mov34/MPN/PAD-1 family protein n=1 Tax=Massilia oculi TaxID=945844 RepID=UPI00351CC5A5